MTASDNSGSKPQRQGRTAAVFFEMLAKFDDPTARLTPERMEFGKAETLKAVDMFIEETRKKQLAAPPEEQGRFRAEIERFLALRTKVAATPCEPLSTEEEHG